MNKKIKNWMSRENKTFTLITGEKTTNATVVYTHACFVALMIVIGLVGRF